MEDNRVPHHRVTTKVAEILTLNRKKRMENICCDLIDRRWTGSVGCRFVFRNISLDSCLWAPQNRELFFVLGVGGGRAHSLQLHASPCVPLETIP